MTGAAQAWSWTLSIQVGMNSWKKSLFGGAGRASGVSRASRADKTGPELGVARPKYIKPGAGFLVFLRQVGGIVERRG